MGDGEGDGDGDGDGEGEGELILLLVSIGGVTEESPDLRRGRAYSTFTTQLLLHSSSIQLTLFFFKYELIIINQSVELYIIIIIIYY